MSLHSTHPAHLALQFLALAVAGTVAAAPNPGAVATAGELLWQHDTGG